MNKVKVFYSWGIEGDMMKLEEKINDFAINHKIINVSIAMDRGTYYAVVLYEVF